MAATDGSWCPPAAKSGGPLPLHLPVATQTRPLASSGSTGTSTDLSASSVVVGGLLIAIGTFLPWWTNKAVAFSSTHNGFQLGFLGLRDGFVTIALGALTVVIGVLALVNPALPRWLRTPSILTGLGVIGVLASCWSVLDNNVVNLEGVTRSVGYGYWTTGAGATLAICGGISLCTAKRANPTSDAPFQLTP